MQRCEYLHCVKDFVDWLRLRVSGVEPFKHQYTLRCYDWICDSLWEAHENYSWLGANFDENQSILSRLRNDLRNALATDNTRLFLDTAYDVLDWGGVTHHDRLCSLGAKALPAFRKSIELLDPITADTKFLTGCNMNAGLAKLFSLMIDGYSDVRRPCRSRHGLPSTKYCEHHNVRVVPDLLAFR